MKLRLILALFAVVLIAACAGDTADEAPAAEAVAEPAMDDAAAVQAVADEWVAHYNMHHASVVAGYHIEETITLMADTSVNQGVEAVTAALEAEMANSPTLAVNSADTIVAGDWAVQRGDYGIELAPEGADAVSATGNFMTAFQRVDGEWKVAYVIVNYNTDPPEGTTFASPAAEDAPEEFTSVMADLNDYYETHFNMGHGSMVADNTYTEDAVSMIANLPLAEGRAAIGEMLQERIDASSPELAIHPVGEVDIGDGYMLSGGWYELTSGDGNSAGNYMVLARQGDDGSYKLHWAVSNGRPAN